jgi:LysM repeat protein
VGIVLLLLAAAIYLRRRAQEEEQSGLHVRLAEEPSRLPIVLAGAGVLFLLLLLVPNVSGGSTPTTPAAPRPAALDAVGDVAQEPVSSVPAQGVEQQQVAPPVEDVSAGEGTVPEGEVYIVQSGDSVWSIAQRFGTTVEAIVEANDLENPSALQVGQQLIIPPPDAATGDGG